MTTSYDDTDKVKWRTGLFAANPVQARDLVLEVDGARAAERRRLVDAARVQEDACREKMKGLDQKAARGIAREANRWRAIRVWLEGSGSFPVYLDGGGA